MKAAVADFESRIEELLEFLARSEAEQELLSLLHARRDALPKREQDALTVVVAGSTNTRQYVYAVAVVSLYGVLERLVDALLQRVVARFAEISPTVEKLPEAVGRNHYQLSLDLLASLERDKYRTDISVEATVENLHLCLSKKSPYKLNTAAFAMHRGNVTLVRIAEILKSIGVHQHLVRIARVPSFVEYIRTTDPERDPYALTEADARAALEPLDDLVRRRNDVSHGVVLADDIQAIPLLRDRAMLVRAYGRALSEVLHQEVMQHAVALGCARALGRPLEVFNHSVACFETDAAISVGDELIALTGEAAEPVRASAIARIEIDGVAQDSVAGGPQVRLGVQVSFRAKRTHEYFLLPAMRATV